ncbi:hypothetical protein [Lentzea sp. NBRC 102530]|uniref:hypothetical protein n=1 Tax=Lentzea sp. NBRC 102530 TaxID=3032201 RepID=UPI00255255CC|nr:hypothetical protein [Lentzea sp. NBRC 102530]
MTKYAGTRAAVVVAAGDISLAIAKRLAEGGARVVLTADTEAGRAEARAEVGSAAQAVAPAEIATALEGQRIDFLFTDAVAGTSPLLPHLHDGGAVVLTTPTPAETVLALVGTLADRRIRVNAVAPVASRGRAEEVARVALFLATEATCTTGAHVPVDGGLNHR